MPSRRFNDAFNKLAAAEDRFLAGEFLAPVLRGGEVRVRIAGVVCKLRVTPAEFEGWGVFRPVSIAAATLAREAELAERRRYLALFPQASLILCRREGDAWLAVPAHRGDRRFRIEGLAPVRLAEEAQQFDVVQTRFDGAHFWFEAIDPRRDPATAAYLRRALQENCDPEQLDRPGLTPEEKEAYAVNVLLREEVRRRREAGDVDRIKDALRHAGAELHEYLERPDSYRVTFTVAGRRHVSAVDKNDLTVQTAGICLSGEDAKFDLASLVGVLREAEATGEIW